MGTQILKDCTIWLNQYDVTADVTGLDSDRSFEEIDSTTFGSPTDAAGNKTRERKAGLEDSMLGFSSFWDPALIESVVEPLVGTSNNVLAGTVAGVAGDRAFFARGELLGLKKGFPVGKMATLEASVKTSSTEGVVAGSLILPKATRSTSSSGSAVLEGAVAAGKKVYALAQVFSIAGTSTPTLALKIQSDDNSGFTSPTDRITFTNFTAVGAQLSSLAGSITDTYWRATWTLSGTSPQFGFAVCLGIR